MHTKCYNIKLADLNLIKDTFKCKSCMQIRRLSLDQTPVQSIVPMSINDSTCAMEVNVSKISEEVDDSSVVCNSGSLGEVGETSMGIKNSIKEENSSNNITLDLIFAELCTLKLNNASLLEKVNSLEDINGKLLSKVDKLESLVQSKHCLCNFNANGNLLRKSSLKSNDQSIKKNALASTSAATESDLTDRVDTLTNISKCAESSNSFSFAAAAKAGFNQMANDNYL